MLLQIFAIKRSLAQNLPEGSAISMEILNSNPYEAHWNLMSALQPGQNSRSSCETIEASRGAQQIKQTASRRHLRPSTCKSCWQGPEENPPHIVGCRKPCRTNNPAKPCRPLPPNMHNSACNPGGRTQQWMLLLPAGKPFPSAAAG